MAKRRGASLEIIKLLQDKTNVGDDVYTTSAKRFPIPETINKHTFQTTLSLLQHTGYVQYVGRGHYRTVEALYEDPAPDLYRKYISAISEKASKPGGFSGIRKHRKPGPKPEPEPSTVEVDPIEFIKTFGPRDAILLALDLLTESTSGTAEHVVNLEARVRHAEHEQRIAEQRLISVSGELANARRKILEMQTELNKRPVRVESEKLKPVAVREQVRGVHHGAQINRPSGEVRHGVSRAINPVAVVRRVHKHRK